MGGAFLFVRFFPGFTSAFPYDRVVDKSDNEMTATLGKLTRDWWRKATNLRRADSRRKRLIQESSGNRRFSPKEWAKGAVWRPNGSPVVSRTEALTTEFAAEAHGSSKAKEQFLELASVEKWYIGTTLVLDWPYHVSPRFALSFHEQLSKATATATALQTALSELADATFNKRQWIDDDDLYAQANPRLFVLAESIMDPAEVIVAQEQCIRIRNPVARNPSFQEGLLRFFWPEVMPTLRLADPEAAANWPDREVFEGPYAQLKSAAVKLRLRGNEAKIIDAIYANNGSISLANLAVKCDWSDHQPQWNAARVRLNGKLKNEGWKLTTINNRATATLLPECARK